MNELRIGEMWAARTVNMSYFYGFVSLVWLSWKCQPISRVGASPCQGGSLEEESPGSCPWCHLRLCFASRWCTGRAPICMPTTQLSPLGRRCWETCWLMPSTAWDSPGWVTVAVAITSGKEGIAGRAILGQTYFVLASEQGFKVNVNSGYFLWA